MREGITAVHYRQKFLNGLIPETAIYKYIPVDYIVEMKRNRQLKFKRVNNWEDVYENYFLKQDFILADGTPVSAEAISQSVYGQCWTLQEESDAMWRIYSSDEQRAIKVKTTAEILMDVLYVDDMCMADTSIGIVNYLPQHEIENEYRHLSENRIPIEDINKNISKSLLTKRDVFAHEQEVRIFKMLSSNEPDNYIDMPFNPDLLFEEFIIDPRVSETEEIDIRRTLVGCGINEEMIRKSHLYSFNRYTLVL